MPLLKSQIKYLSKCDNLSLKYFYFLLYYLLCRVKTKYIYNIYVYTCQTVYLILARITRVKK